jgi:hypothetical protein
VVELYLVGDDEEQMKVVGNMSLMKLVIGVKRRHKEMPMRNIHSMTS